VTAQRAGYSAVEPILTVRPFQPADEPAWQDFLRDFDGFGHSYALGWREVITDVFGHRPHYLVAEADGRLVGVLPLFEVNSWLFGRSLISIPYLNGGGPLATSPSAETVLLEAAATTSRSLAMRYCELRCRQELTACDEKKWRRRDHKVAALLPLPDTPEVLWKTFSPKLRSQIRKPTKEGLSVAVISGLSASPTDIKGFYEVFATNMRDLGTPVYPRRLFEKILEAFGADAYLALARKDEKVLAGGLLIGRGSTIEILLASSLRAFNRLAPNMLMYWTAMDAAIERGYRIFDFGRSSIDSSTLRFKRQWGAETRPLPWYYIADGKVPDISNTNNKFRTAVNVWRKLPLPVANTIGPLIARQLV